MGRINLQNLNILLGNSPAGPLPENLVFIKVDWIIQGNHVQVRGIQIAGINRPRNPVAFPDHWENAWEVSKYKEVALSPYFWLYILIWYFLFIHSLASWKLWKCNFYCTWLKMVINGSFKIYRVLGLLRGSPAKIFPKLTLVSLFAG